MLNYAKRALTDNLPTAYHSARNLKRDLANLLYPQKPSSSAPMAGIA